MGKTPDSRRFGASCFQSPGTQDQVVRFCLRGGQVLEWYDREQVTASLSGVAFLAEEKVHTDFYFRVFRGENAPLDSETRHSEHSGARPSSPLQRQQCFVVRAACLGSEDPEVQCRQHAGPCFQDKQDSKFSGSRGAAARVDSQSSAVSTWKGRSLRSLETLGDCRRESCQPCAFMRFFAFPQNKESPCSPTPESLTPISLRSASPTPVESPHRGHTNSCTSKRHEVLNLNQ